MDRNTYTAKSNSLLKDIDTYDKLNDNKKLAKDRFKKENRELIKNEKK